MNSLCRPRCLLQLHIQFCHSPILPSTKHKDTDSMQPSSFPLYGKVSHSFLTQSYMPLLLLRSYPNGPSRLYFHQHSVQGDLGIYWKVRGLLHSSPSHPCSSWALTRAHQTVHTQQLRVVVACTSALLQPLPVSQLQSCFHSFRCFLEQKSVLSTHFHLSPFRLL